MIDSNNIIYFIKEYFAIIFYLLIIFNIVIRVIVTKKSKKKSKKKKSRKGGGILGDIWYVFLCIITFGMSCEFWDYFEVKWPRPFGTNTEKWDGMYVFGRDDIGSLGIE
jgi:hypothetical protein